MLNAKIRGLENCVVIKLVITIKLLREQLPRKGFVTSRRAADEPKGAQGHSLTRGGGGDLCIEL